MKIAPFPSSLEELRWWASPNIQNWPTIANIPDRDDRLNRCILTGLGSNLARNNNRRSMASRRSTGTHQSSGTESSVSGAISLIQVVHSSTTTRSPDEKFYRGSICEQERGNTITHIVDTSHRPMGSDPECGFLGYSRTYPGRTPNEIADTAFRLFNNHSEWMLGREIFQRITRRVYRPVVDQWTCLQAESTINFLMCLGTQTQEQWQRMHSFAIGVSGGVGFFRR